MMNSSAPSYLAYQILAGFDKHFRLFMRISRGAKENFIQQDWVQANNNQVKRIKLYSQQVSLQTQKLIEQLDQPVISTDLWRDTKKAYSKLLEGHPQAEVAETFFNSVFSRLFRHRGLDEQHLFLHTKVRKRPPFQPEKLSKYRFFGNDPTTALSELINPRRFQRPFADLEQDLALVWQRLEPIVSANQYNRVELLNCVFYRNKGAYLVGRLIGPRGFAPLLLPIRHSDNGLYIDAVLSNQDDLSVVFSFTRAYFMVNTDHPGMLVSYLKQLMPRKTWAELYSALGLQKHGKTEFYRSFLHHLDHSDDKFDVAPGIKGMVMSVFTLPSLPMVFKIIKDEFAPPKEVTKEDVKSKYDLVKQHDRVGRMADTQEFSNFVFPRERFSQALIDELLKVASQEIELTDTHIIIHHLYAERRMVPLNMYLDGATQEQIDHAIYEYGLAIKQLASVNIFPGDMLFKNFGLTRHNRVVFYDYDEISYMTECNFRTIPKAQTLEQEMAAEPWFSIGPNDVFPEEFGHFLLARPSIRQAFLPHHQDLLTAEYWQQIKDNVAAEKIPDVYPYRRDCRLR
ncbi:bifunctional isocitrate dehydrogenase kinase/phosphatase [Ferrimonas lipolytica]|uniref:Isocitrate dehydrogenase kinase/phosphatase n=1 Tax=Ferrimonas lipolytica TaxID=2724191 RepID=A0A6H1UGV5_9GAMM|nr:bifunctional isocitrate dehydrogenase kinase/phosphatase [Ferrimonas lipolytica]QIZ77553.1 bifunctional isocitrate dehydrogenase kinase/phosphatase [Ferrimonas lipolytica]